MITQWEAIMTSHFDLKLDKILSEMPIRHFKAFKDRKRSPFSAQFHDNSMKGYTSPKYMAIVSDKLSRLSGYNINIFVIEGYMERYPRETVFKLETLAKHTGVPIEDLKDAINFIMTGNAVQLEFSPWLYMHQLAEAINLHCSIEEQGDTILHFKDFMDRIDKLVPDWKYRLKMGSARKAKATGGSIGDLLQEMITEYLWHGGRIRFDYPDDVDKNEIDELFDSFKATLEGLLNGLVGEFLVNDPGQ